MIMCFNCIANAQPKTINDILNAIQREHPQLKMYDADIRSMDEAAKGARSWMYFLNGIKYVINGFGLRISNATETHHHYYKTLLHLFIFMLPASVILVIIVVSLTASYGNSIELVHFI